jgi:ADP-ribose pyrophosphatase YjhB (NUDIX family)
MTNNSYEPEYDIPRWLVWAREIQAISQTGMHFAENVYQRQRYQRLLKIAAEIIAEYSNLDQNGLVDLFNEQIGYATPRVDVRGAVFLDGKLLLVREILDDGWTMPGGWADVGDIPSSAVEREVVEESGFEVKARKIIGIYDANRSGKLEVFHAFKIVSCVIFSVVRRARAKKLQKWLSSPRMKSRIRCPVNEPAHATFWMPSPPWNQICRQYSIDLRPR